jgi:hypothetical protein
MPRGNIIGPGQPCRRPSGDAAVADGSEAATASEVGLGRALQSVLLRHALASAMATNTEPASIIAAQLPRTAPRLAGVIEGVFGPPAREWQAVSAGRRAEGNPEENPNAKPT